MKTPKSFEQASARLEEILAQMSAPDITLSQSLKLYAEAAELTAYCKETLDNARLTITEIDQKYMAPAEMPAGEE